MDLWIIRDGEKAGPFHDFEIRRKILSGDVTSDTPAWHAGMDEWKTLGEIEWFRREFEPLTPEIEIEHEDEPAEVSTAQPRPAHRPAYYRRFWARWLDLTVYASLWWFIMWAARQDVDAVFRNPWIMFLLYVPWFVFEVLLIHYTATTPGKWLLGLRVTNLDGSRLDLNASTRRALRVLFTGVGFGWGILALFCQALSFFTTKRLGHTLWDHLGGHQVQVSPLRHLRVLACVAIFFGAMHLQAMVLYPTYVELITERNPQLKSFLEENRQWSLPRRHP